MKVLIDTNVVIDVLSNRMPYADHSSEILAMCEAGTIEGYVTATTVTDIYYIMSKAVHAKQQLHVILEKLLTTVNVCDVTGKDILNALKMRTADFEDAVQAECAVSCGAEYIITRNVKDFEKSQVKAVTPTAFMRFGH